MTDGAAPQSVASSVVQFCHLLFGNAASAPATGRRPALPGCAALRVPPTGYTSSESTRFKATSGSSIETQLNQTRQESTVNLIQLLQAGNAMEGGAEGTERRNREDTSGPNVLTRSNSAWKDSRTAS